MHWTESRSNLELRHETLRFCQRWPTWFCTWHKPTVTVSHRNLRTVSLSMLQAWKTLSWHLTLNSHRNRECPRKVWKTDSHDLRCCAIFHFFFLSFHSDLILKCNTQVMKKEENKYTSKKKKTHIQCWPKVQFLIDLSFWQHAQQRGSKGEVRKPEWPEGNKHQGQCSSLTPR